MSKRQSGQSFLIRDSVANLIRLGSLVAIALGLFAVISGGLAIYLNLSAQLELERADRAATQQADRIASELSSIQNSLRDASVVDAARSGANDALRSALRERGVVSILDARILPANIDDIALAEDIDLDFAATELVVEAIRNERAEIRVLEPGTPAESLAFAQRIPGDSGVLLLRLTVSVVTSLLQDPQALDFVALAQRSNPGYTVLSATGRSAAAPIRSVPVTGSSLALQWSRAVVAAPLDNRTAIILGCSGIIALMAGLLLRRRTRLARYLSAGEQPAEPVAGSHTPAAAAGPQTWAGHQPRTTRDTMVLGEDEEPEQAPEPEQPPGPRTRASDLPEWLRESDDYDYDELGMDEATLEATQHMPDAPLSHEGEDEEDESLLEDFDDYQGVDPALFADEGIHGMAGQNLDVPAMIILGQAVGSEAAQRGLRRVCIAHDGRESGPELLDGLAQGLAVSGIDVVDLGAVPAPVAWFAAMRMQKAGAAVVTGGERPEEVNGLEVVLDGDWLDIHSRQGLLERIRQQEFSAGSGNRSDSDEARAYEEQLAAELRLSQPLRVVLDCGNAVTGAMAPRLFEALGVDVIPLNADAETRAAEIAEFSGQERLQDLKLCVDNFAADLGIAFDRIAARMQVVGPEGEVVDAARIVQILAADLAEHVDGPVLAADTILTEQLANLDLGGVEVLDSGRDAVAVHRSLRERSAHLAAHEDGTICVAANWHGLPDGLYAAAWLLTVLAADGSPIGELLSQAGDENSGESGDSGND